MSWNGFYKYCVKNILWEYLQTLYVETIPYYVFDYEEKIGR